MEIKTEISPVILSVSRASDIPAFYAKWFGEKIEAGHCLWTNPFSGAITRIDFSNVRSIVFWTKNPAPLFPYLELLEKRKINYYFQFTLNDYDNERLEPRVPCVNDRIDIFRYISEKVGKERVIWRFDPILLSNSISVQKVADKIKRVGDQIHKYTEKLVFSFADINQYAHVKQALDKCSVGYREPSREDQVEIVNKLIAVNRSWGLQLATCGEHESFDGISKNQCIDGDLMARVFSHDKKLMSHLGVSTQKSLPISIPGMPVNMKSTSALKDAGQREACGCIKSKDIGQYQTCPHGCVYCYANGTGKIDPKKILNN